MLPACIARRLSAGGLCIIALAIRWQTLFSQFEGACARRGLRMAVHRLQLPPDHDLEGTCALCAWARERERERERVDWTAAALPSNNPHDHMILRVDLVDSHGRWKRPCLQTAHMTI